MYICRTDLPANSSDNPITLEEWKVLVRDVPQMHLYEGEDSLPSYVTPPNSSDGLARWSGHPRMDIIWFNYKDGAISVQGYDGYVSMRLRALATRLGARVMDENGNFL